jgi:hypothetical protein
MATVTIPPSTAPTATAITTPAPRDDRARDAHARDACTADRAEGRAQSAPRMAREQKRPHSDSVGDAFESIQAAAESLATPGVSTQQDLEAVRKTIHEVAVAHVSQVRDVMLELRFGDADPSWLAARSPRSAPSARWRRRSISKGAVRRARRVRDDD